MIKLAIALPAYGFHLDVGHAAMWLGVGAALAQAADKFELVMFTEYSINGIDLCRNTAMYDALQAGADYCLMIDADTFHQSARSGADIGAGLSGADAIADAGVQILQMIRDADRLQYAAETPNGHELKPIELPLTLSEHTGVGLVGAPVLGRGIGDPNICVRGLIRDDGPGYGDLAQVSFSQVRNRIVPVKQIGGACIAVNLQWMRKHWPTGPWFVMDHDYAGRPKNRTGEDYFICNGIHQRGGIVLCDGRFRPEHVDRRRLVSLG